MTLDELRKKSKELENKIVQLDDCLDSEKDKDEIVKLKIKSQEENFWDDSKEAGMVMQKIENLKDRIERWQKLKMQINNLQEFLGIIEEENSNDLKLAIGQYRKSLDEFRIFEIEKLYSGPYDEGNAVVSIHAGAGGDDAQDWTGMVLRMFLKFCERKLYKVTILQETKGSEAGIKSVMFEVSGKFAYGNFAPEAGVHRLVRLSPFNSDNLRQTSFVLVEVIPLIENNKEIEIDSTELKIDTFRASGAGGQSVNTTDSAVRVTHLPTKTVVSCQNERSQLQNKEKALAILRSRLLQIKENKRIEKEKRLKGAHISAEWGSQIRSYVLHPYKMVKDHRTGEQTADIESVLAGNLDTFIEKYLRSKTKE